MVFFLLVIALVLMFSGCGKKDSGGSTYKVSGRVLTADGERGVPDVAIAFSGFSVVATADKNGWWSQSGLKDSVTVTPTAPKGDFGWEFQPASKTVNKSTIDVNFAVKDLLYYDGFSDSGSGWGSSEGEISSRDYKDNEYEIKIITEGYVTGVWMSIFPVNYRIQVDVRRYEEEEGYGGILFNISDNQDFYYSFVVEPCDQTYCLYRGGERLERIVDWTSSEYINEGDGVNRLEVVKTGGKVDLYINGNLVANDIPVDQHEEETVLGAGMYVGAWGTPVTFRFDDFQVFMEGEVLTPMGRSTISSPIFRALEAAEMTAYFSK